MKVVAGPEPPGSKGKIRETKESSSAGAGAGPSSQDDHHVISSELPPEIVLIWRCACGKESDRFSPQMTKHISDNKESETPHRWSLVNKATGEIAANSIAEARMKGLKATAPSNPPRHAGGSGKEKDQTPEDRLVEEASKAKLGAGAGSSFIVNYISATDKLPSELLLLYKLFYDRCIAMGKEPPTRGEWITQTISQFYMEHAVDFDIRGMAADFIKEQLGGRRVGKR
jgi:hypothetical protein